LILFRTGYVATAVPCSRAAVSSSADHFPRPAFRMNAPAASRPGSRLVFAEKPINLPFPFTRSSRLVASPPFVALLRHIPFLRGGRSPAGAGDRSGAALARSGLVPVLERLVDLLAGQERRKQFRQAARVEPQFAPDDLVQLPPPHVHVVLELLRGLPVGGDVRAVAGYPGPHNHLVLQPPDTARLPRGVP